MSDFDYGSHLLVDVRDGVGVITLNRPEKLNALTSEMLLGLSNALKKLGHREDIIGIVVTGNGRAFTAGHDLSRSNLATDLDGVREAAEAFHQVTLSCLEAQVPTIAAVNGIAVGGGFELTLAFDRRIGTPQTSVYLPENSLGLVISNASSLLLERAMGASAALDMVLGSRRFNSKEALAKGILDELVDGDPVLAAVERIHEYTSPDSSGPEHLRLLRPEPSEVRAAMDRETEAAISAWGRGSTSRSVERQWGAKHPTSE